MATPIRRVPEAVSAGLRTEGPRAVRVQTRLPQALVPPRPGEVASIRVLGATLGPAVAAVLTGASKPRVVVGQVASKATAAAYLNVQVSIPSPEGPSARRGAVHDGQSRSVATPDAASGGEDAHGERPLEELAPDPGGGRGPTKSGAPRGCAEGSSRKELISSKNTDFETCRGT